MQTPEHIVEALLEQSGRASRVFEEDDDLRADIDLLPDAPSYEYWDLHINDPDEEDPEEGRIGSYFVYVRVPTFSDENVEEVDDWKHPIFQQVTRMALKAGYIDHDEIENILAMIRVPEGEVGDQLGASRLA